MDRLAGSLIGELYGAEEFIFLLGKCLFNYGSVIGSGMYQHHTEEPTADGTSFTDANDDPNRWIEVDLNNHPAPNRRQASDTSVPAKRASTSTTNSCSAARAKRTSAEIGKIPGGFMPSAAAPGGTQQRPRPPAQARPTTKMNGSPSSRNNGGNAQQEADDHALHLRETVNGLKVDLDDSDGILDFSSVAGLSQVKTALEEFATFFMHFPHLTRNLRQRSTTGILLFGPQGTGKTLLVKSFAQKYNLSLYDVRASAIMSKFVGEAEKFVRALFAEVRANSPAILMLDECDGLLCNPASDAMQSHNYRLLQNELKNQWSDLIYTKAEVVVVGLTNKPQDIDMDGFGRRLSLKLHVDLPDEQGCQAIIRGAMGRLRHQLEDDDFAVLGLLAHEKHLSGYDVDCLVESQLRKAIRGITLATHFADRAWKEPGKDGKEDGGEEIVIAVPCGQDEPGARQVRWTEAAIDGDPESVSYRPFTFGEMESAVRRAKPTVTDDMRRRHAEFASQYGAED